MTRISWDNADITEKLDLKLPLGVFKVLSRRSAFRQGRRVVRFAADGRENNFENEPLHTYTSIEILTRPRYPRRLRESTRVVLDGRDVDTPVGREARISSLVAALDRRLYPQRRLAGLSVDGRERATLSDMDPVGCYDTVELVSGPVAAPRKAVVSLSIGEKFDPVMRATFPHMRRYAEKIGADFIALTEPKLFLCEPHYEMFRLFDLWDSYEQIVFVDADILIRQEAADIFAEVPPDKLGVFNEGRYVCNLFEEEKAMRQCGAIDWQRGVYYNSGVIVASYLHRDLFARPEEDELICSLAEQTTFNYRVIRDSYPVHELPVRFNCMSYCGAEMTRADFIHFAGGGFFMHDREGKRLGKKQQILRYSRTMDA